MSAQLVTALLTVMVLAMGIVGYRSLYLRIKPYAWGLLKMVFTARRRKM